MTKQTFEGVSANSPATISVALSGLYSAWAGTTRPQTTPRAEPPHDSRAPAGEEARP
ncbi:hypothetical protein ACLB9X_33615 [Streptomyces sp. 5K101]|uniref:hypothetical protein n=1 Tax=Streptomyces sp. 5K101 TaxID=3390037 RepID=UPI0039748ACB